MLIITENPYPTLTIPANQHGGSNIARYPVRLSRYWAYTVMTGIEPIGAAPCAFR